MNNKYFALMVFCALFACGSGVTSRVVVMPNGTDAVIVGCPINNDCKEYYADCLCKYEAGEFCPKGFRIIARDGLDYGKNKDNEKSLQQLMSATPEGFRKLIVQCVSGFDDTDYGQCLDHSRCFENDKYTYCKSC